MDKPPRDGVKLEGILRETLFEISQGKRDPFHRVLADVLEEITSPGEKDGDRTEKPKNESG